MKNTYPPTRDYAAEKAREEMKSQSLRGIDRHFRAMEEQAEWTKNEWEEDEFTKRKY